MVAMSTPGIEWTRLVGWMAANVPDAGEPTGVSLIAGGRSNLTYVIETRRAPAGAAPPAARARAADRARHGPRVAGHPGARADPGAGARTGRLLRRRGRDRGAVLPHGPRGGRRPSGPRRSSSESPPSEIRRLAERLAEVLAAIHAVDYQEVGLGDFGRPGRLHGQAAQALGPAVGAVEDRASCPSTTAW